MRTLILTALFSLVSSHTILAKDYLLLTAQTGLVSYKISDSKNVRFTSQTGISPAINIAAMLNLKHIQAGIGLEFGNIKKPYSEYYYDSRLQKDVWAIYNRYQECVRCL